MGDLKISYRYPNWKVFERKFEDSIKFVEKFAQKNIFKVSTSKTSMSHFTKLFSPSSIELRLGSIRIQKSETVKYFDLVFDSELTGRLTHSNQSPNVIRP